MGTGDLHTAFKLRRSQREFGDGDVCLEHVKRLLWAGQGVTSEEGLRTVPSAHALHPLRLYVCAGKITGLAPGIYQYDALSTDLAPCAQHDARAALERAALGDQPWLAAAAGVITICADMTTVTEAFADQPPEGLRGQRYAFIEAGAAAQNISLQAALDGLACVLVAGFKDDVTADILKLEPQWVPILHMCFGGPVETEGRQDV